jgi:hemerythrin-like metal-binding protein
VGVKELDSHHKKLIHMINELYEAMNAGKASKLMIDLLENLLRYTEYHFSVEEKFMEECEYAGLESHREIHTIFVNKISAFKKDFIAGNALISQDVMEFLKEWLSDHICRTDKEYSECLNSCGIK